MTRRSAGAAMLVVITVASACSRQTIVVSPTMLHSHVHELRSRGKATMPVEPDGTIELGLRDRVRVEDGGETRSVAVADLIADCPEARPFAGDTVTRSKYVRCGLMRITAPIAVDRRWVGAVSALQVVGAIVVLLVVGTVVGYVTRCSKPDDGC